MRRKAGGQLATPPMLMEHRLCVCAVWAEGGMLRTHQPPCGTHLLPTHRRGKRSLGQMRAEQAWNQLHPFPAPWAAGRQEERLGCIIIIANTQWVLCVRHHPE